MFLHTFHPQPVIFQFGVLKIYWYGLIIAIAVLAGLLIVIKLNNKYKQKNILIFKNKDQILDLCFYLIIFGLIGARIYEVFLFLPFYLKDPLAIFKIWNGGLAIHGAILAGILIIILFVRKHKIDLGLSCDLIAPALALGQVIGRWGNYFNQELFGLPTKLPFGIPIDLARRPIEYESFTFFHPTFLYESLLNLILAGVLVLLHYRRLARLNRAEVQPPLWRLNLRAKNKKGNIVLIYLIGYSLIRFFLEFIKIDETPLAFGLRLPQAVSMGLIVAAGLIFLFMNHTKISKTLKGKVIRGRGVGKQFGVPTANIKLNKNYQIPEFGVFSGFVFINKRKYKAVVFIGPRPTFNLSEPAIEAAILDFSGNLYDNEVGLQIGKKIRDIKKFSSHEDFKKQILDDIEQVKKFLNYNF